MPTLTRASLASIVCPSAPFLAPRLLRTYAPLAALAPQLRPVPTTSRRYLNISKAPKGKKTPGSVTREKTRIDPKLQAHLDDAALDQQFRQAVNNRNLQSLMELYPSILPSGILTRDHTRRIAQTLHSLLRAGIPKGEAKWPTHLQPFLQQFIKDIQKGALPVHPFAFVHILGIYKERKMFDEGHHLWQWVVQQDDTHVTPAVYGAAIELMACGKILRLPELENLYLDALKRFPGTFVEYHLSPDAIVPNRGQPISIPNVPVALLQGITTARLLYGDWKKAYLGLDTALRLYPSQLPPRFFELFMDNRPLPEAYTVFLVACRAGVVVKPTCISMLLGKIRSAMRSCNSMHDRIVLLRAVANALYANLQAGGHLEPIHVGQFLTAFASLLPELAPGTEYQGDMASHRNRVVTEAHRTLSTLLQAGMPASPPAFISLITVAGELRVPDLLRVSLQDAETAHVNLGEVGERVVLSSAGWIGAKALIEERWTLMVHKAASRGQQINFKDWQCLARACMRADHRDYLHAQMKEQEHTLSAQSRASLLAASEQESWPSRELDRSPLDEIENEFVELSRQVKNIAAIVMSGSPLDLQKTPFYMSLHPKRGPISTYEHLQTVYDMYTVDPHQPPLSTNVLPPALSPTRIPLDKLRFENWVSIVTLMDQAHEVAYERQRNINLSGGDTWVREKKPFKLDGPRTPFSLFVLKGQVKTLRDTVRKPAIVPDQKLIQPSPVRKVKAAGKDLHNAGFVFRPVGLSHDASSPAVSPTETFHPEQQTSILPGPGKSHALAQPSLTYYVGLQTDHDAPVPKLARNPLKSRIAAERRHKSSKKYQAGMKVEDFMHEEEETKRNEGSVS